MDPGENDLASPGSDHAPGRGHDGVLVEAAEWPSRDRDDAEAAPLVAPGLHLEIDAYPPRWRHFGRAPETDLKQGARALCTAQSLRERFLLVVTQYEVDPIDRFDLLRVRHRVATHDHDPGVGVIADRTADRHARCLGRLARHGAGIDDHQIRIVVAGADDSVGAELLGHRVRLRLV